MKTLKMIASLVVALMVFGSLALGASAQGLGTTSLDDATAQALYVALDDEYHAYAFYAAVIAQFGPVAPFANIIHSEASHIQALQTLMTRYGMDIPANPYTGNLQAPATLTEALHIGAEAEIANVRLYDTLAFVTQPDIRAVFEQLRTASQIKHLPAFQNALLGNPTGIGSNAWATGRGWSR